MAVPALRPLALALALGALAALPLSPAAVAQDQGTQQSATPEAPDPDSLTQEQLQSFAAATMEIQSITTDWQNRIQNADSEERANELRSQAQGEMVEAVEAEGMSVEEYNGIVRAAEGNQELTETIRGLMQEMANDG